MSTSNIPADHAQRGARAAWIGVLVLLTLVGFSRLAGLGRLDPWLDEVHSYIASGDLIRALLRWETIEQQYHSPLPYIEIKIARTLLGSSNMALRLPAALYGTAAVLLLYLVVGRAVGWWTGFWSALLLAANPMALEWGREARMYSHCLFYSLLLMAVATAAVRHVRIHREDWLNWRWWLLGVCFMLAHAGALMALFSVLATGLWLLIVAGAGSMRDPRGSWTILRGATLCGLVFLSSWSLTGFGKLLYYIGGRSGSSGESARSFADNAMTALQGLAGHSPGWLTLLLWLLALAGLALLAWRGRWQLTLLVLMVAIFPWLVYPRAAAQLHFSSKYVITGLIALSAGLGVLAPWGWQLAQPRLRLVARGAIVAAFAALAVLWWPNWREIYTVPRNAMTRTLAPLRDHGVKGEVLMVLPEFMVVMDEYYRFSNKVNLVRAPAADARTRAASPYFSADFETLFAPEKVQARDIPPGTWVLLSASNPSQLLPQLEPVLRAYGLDTPERRQELEETCRGAHTVSFRLSDQGIAHPTSAEGRKYR